MNLTGPVGGRMVAGIIAGDQKSETASKRFSGDADVSSDWGRAAELQRGLASRRQSVAQADDGGGISRGGSCFFRPRN
ncbi:hypothetical protein PanWU01x14_242780, partial [Parasponia andersonii]